MTRAPQTAPWMVDMGLDAGHQRTYRSTTTAEKIDWLLGQAATWEHRASEYEASADRWAARGAVEQAASNLATARNYRRQADRCRAEVEQIRGEQK